MPEGDEISLAEARQIAKTYIYDHFSPSNDIFDEAYYTPYVQYMLTTDDDDQYCKRWDIEYEALTPETPSYYILVTPSGQVEEEQSYQKIIERTNSSPIPETLISSIDELGNAINDDSFYTTQNMAAFRENYADIIAAVKGNNDSKQYRVFEHLLEIPYGLPSSTDVTQEHAYQTALAEIKSKGWSDTWLERCHYTQSYREYSNEKPIWRICWKIDWKIDRYGLYHFFHEGDMPFGIVVTVDAKVAK